MTEFGRYQYLLAPQGHVASGDSYTRRYNDIIADVPRKSRIVDDVLLHDQSINEAFFHVFEYLQLCAEKGITISPGKFKFVRAEVDFVGYHIGWEGYRPSNNAIAAIRDFPMSENPTITNIRS